MNCTLPTPKAFLALQMLRAHPEGLFGSQIIHLSKGGLSRSATYALLDRLAEKGFVRKTPVPPSPKFDLKRTRYEVTEAGNRAYKSFVACVVS